MKCLRLLLVLAALLALGAMLASDTALAQSNPFARRVQQPEPEPEPAPNPEPVLPKQVSQGPSILDYEAELGALSPVVVRNGIAAIRTPDRLYFLKEGQKFRYNGTEYIVGIEQKTFSLSLPRAHVEEEISQLEEAGEPIPQELAEATEEMTGEKAKTKNAQKGTVVFERTVGRSIDLTALSAPPSLE